VQEEAPEETLTHSSSNESGLMPMSSLHRRIPGTATAATPPWLVARVADRVRGRGRSTTWNPSARSRRRLTESASC